MAIRLYADQRIDTLYRDKVQPASSLSALLLDAELVPDMRLPTQQNRKLEIRLASRVGADNH